MAIPKHLILIRGTYYANVRVPSEIAESYGKETVRKSLREKDEKKAGKLVHAKVAEIEREFADHRAKLKAQAVAAEAVQSTPKPAPTPQSFADLGRQHGREIAEQALTIRADLYEAAVANPKEFWRGARQKFSEPDQFTYFDKLTADGDLDRVVSYIVRTTTEGRIADLKRMVDTGAMGELLTLALERQPDRAVRRMG